MERKWSIYSNLRVLRHAFNKKVLKMGQEPCRPITKRWVHLSVAPLSFCGQQGAAIGDALLVCDPHHEAFFPDEILTVLQHGTPPPRGQPQLGTTKLWPPHPTHGSRTGGGARCSARHVYERYTRFKRSPLDALGQSGPWLNHATGEPHAKPCGAIGQDAHGV